MVTRLQAQAGACGFSTCGSSEAALDGWATASALYSHALLLAPTSGNAHNQLAVIAQHRRCFHAACMHYCCALSALSPFETSRSNLASMLRSKALSALLSGLHSATESRHAHQGEGVTGVIPSATAREASSTGAIGISGSSGLCGGEGSSTLAATASLSRASARLVGTFFGCLSPLLQSLTTAEAPGVDCGDDGEIVHGCGDCDGGGDEDGSGNVDGSDTERWLVPLASALQTCQRSECGEYLRCFILAIVCVASQLRRFRPSASRALQMLRHLTLVGAEWLQEATQRQALPEAHLLARALLPALVFLSGREGGNAAATADASDDGRGVVDGGRGVVDGAAATAAGGGAGGGDESMRGTINAGLAQPPPKRSSRQVRQIGQPQSIEAPRTRDLLAAVLPAVNQALELASSDAGDGAGIGATADRGKALLVTPAHIELLGLQPTRQNVAALIRLTLVERGVPVASSSHDPRSQLWAICTTMLACARSRDGTSLDCTAPPASSAARSLPAGAEAGACNGIRDEVTDDVNAGGSMGHYIGGGRVMELPWQAVPPSKRARGGEQKGTGAFGGIPPGPNGVDQDARDISNAADSTISVKEHPFAPSPDPFLGPHCGAGPRRTRLFAWLASSDLCTTSDV